MGWFSRKDGDRKDAASPPPPSGRAATNAPRHWPEVVVKAWVDNPGINLILVTAPLVEGLKATGATFAFLEDRVYADGILRVPFVVTAGGQPHAVFTYPKADAAAAAHFSAVRALLREREGWNAVYYAPAALSPARPAVVLEALDTPHFSRPAKDREEAEYALWWPTADEPTFAGSSALAQLDRWFAALDGYSTILFSSFVRVLELAGKPSPDAEPQLFALPSDRLLVPVDGPGRTPMYLHASATEGLWLALDTRTAPARRDALLKLLADLASGLRTAAERQGIPAREQDHAPLRSWQAVRTQAIERGPDPSARLGRIAEEGRARTCFSGFTSGAERTARTPRLDLSSEMLALVDRAFTSAVALASRPDAREDELPAPGVDGPPNLHPLLVTRKDGHDQQAGLHKMETPDALRLAPAIVNGRGGAQMAVLVWDGIVRDREGKERTDALIARAQERGNASSILFVQRYRPRRRGQEFELLGNREIHGLDEPILPAQETAPEPAPPLSPELEVFLRESLATMVSLLTTGDPTACTLFRRGEPLWSPAMQVRKAGQQGATHVAFAMSSSPGALAAAPRLLAKEAGATMAVFVYDHDLAVDGRPARELRFVAHEPGMARGAVWAQSYLEPDPSRPFTLQGDLRPLFAGSLLFVPPTP